MVWVSGAFRGVLMGAKRGVMTSKKGNRNFYKGRGVKSTGRHTRQGKFIVNPLKIPEIVVPDLEGFTLKAYISHKAPEVKVLPPTAEDIIKSMKPENLPKPKKDLVNDETPAVEEKKSSA